MRFKLDENLGQRAVAAFADRGHDVSSVHLQGLDGSSDETVFAICRDEARVLVTCDLDFANPLSHDPRLTAGIAVLRLPNLPGPPDVDGAIATLLAALEHHGIAGQLWIVRGDRVRVWSPPSTENNG